MRCDDGGYGDSDGRFRVGEEGKIERARRESMQQQQQDSNERRWREGTGANAHVSCKVTSACRLGEAPLLESREADGL